MSLDYSLMMQSMLSPMDALHLLASRLPVRWGDTSHLTGGGVFVGAARHILSGGPPPDPLEVAFGFMPDLCVAFQVDKHEGNTEGLRTLMRGVIALVNQDANDAVLLFNGESIVLQRLRGNLTLNSTFFDAPSFGRTLPEIPLAYNILPLLSPLL